MKTSSNYCNRIFPSFRSINLVSATRLIYTHNSLFVTEILDTKKLFRKLTPSKNFRVLSRQILSVFLFIFAIFVKFSARNFIHKDLKKLWLHRRKKIRPIENSRNSLSKSKNKKNVLLKIRQKLHEFSGKQN